MTLQDLQTLQNILYAEAAGGPDEEIKAVASVFLNRLKREGSSKAFRGSSAFKLQSPQYKKAAAGNFTPYERKVYDNFGSILNQLVANPAEVMPYYYFENVKAFGDPSWSKGLEFQDIGRQRFYKAKPKQSHYVKGY